MNSSASRREHRPALGHQLGEPHAFDGGTRLCRLGNGGSGGGACFERTSGGIGVALLATAARGGVVATRRAPIARALGARRAGREAFDVRALRGRLAARRALVTPRRAPLGAAARSRLATRGTLAVARGATRGTRRTLATRRLRGVFTARGLGAFVAPRGALAAFRLRRTLGAPRGSLAGSGPRRGFVPRCARPGSRLAPGRSLLGGRFVVRGLAHAERALDARGLRGGRLSADGVQRDSPRVRGRIIADRQPQSCAPRRSSSPSASPAAGAASKVLQP
jgi:hypothetical protein